MTTPWQPRGPLPSRVYWVRRGLVVLVALVLVAGIARVLASFGGSDDTAPAARAATSAQKSTASTPSDQPTQQPGRVLTPAAGTATASPTTAPTGVCDDADVLVQPDVTTVAGGREVRLSMVLTTPGEACTWTASAKTLAVKITSGKDRVWSSQDCPASVPTQSVIVRPATQPTSKVAVTWGGHRSVEGCQKGQAWAKPGWYHIVAASLGGDPEDVQFRVVAPPAPVKTVSPSATPSGKASAKPSAKPSGKPSGKPTKKATTKPSARPTPRG